MLELRREQDLALEPLGVDAGAQLRGQHLDDDAAAERVLVREEDARHAAAAELALELVGARQRPFQPVAELVHGCLGGRSGKYRGLGAAVSALKIYPSGLVPRGILVVSSSREVSSVHCIRRDRSSSGMGSGLRTGISFSARIIRFASSTPTNSRSFCRNATSLLAARSCASTQIPLLPRVFSFWTTFARRSQPSGRVAASDGQSVDIEAIRPVERR